MRITYSVDEEKRSVAVGLSSWVDSRKPIMFIVSFVEVPNRLSSIKMPPDSFNRVLKDPFVQEVWKEIMERVNGDTSKDSFCRILNEIGSQDKYSYPLRH